MTLKGYIQRHKKCIDPGTDPPFVNCVFGGYKTSSVPVLCPQVPIRCYMNMKTLINKTFTRRQERILKNLRVGKYSRK